MKKISIFLITLIMFLLPIYSFAAEIGDTQSGIETEVETISEDEIDGPPKAVLYEGEDGEDGEDGVDAENNEAMPIMPISEEIEPEEAPSNGNLSEVTISVKSINETIPASDKITLSLYEFNKNKMETIALKRNEGFSKILSLAYGTYSVNIREYSTMDGIVLDDNIFEISGPTTTIEIPVDGLTQEEYDRLNGGDNIVVNEEDVNKPAEETPVVENEEKVETKQKSSIFVNSFFTITVILGLFLGIVIWRKKQNQEME